MASGCVVIFTKNKSEWYENLLVNNYNCYIVDCYDYKKISKIINNYKNDISKYNKISINAQLTIKNNFNLNKVNLFMEKLIRKIY